MLNSNFWLDLSKPFFALAPMEDVTDTVFRQIVIDCAKPDVCFTEFTNCDGLFSAGRDSVIQRLKFTEIERPLVAQIWGIHPENYFKTAKLLVGLRFDGIDINMGCPEKSVVSHGGCIALINNRNLAHEIILATKEGIQASAKPLPLSIKTRIGYKSIITEDWLGFLLSHKLSALTVHGRTAAEMSQVPNHWEEIAKAVKLRDKLNPRTLIIGNGDVRDRTHGLELIKKYHVDGVMIGRGVLSNLWAFSPHSAPDLTVAERLNLLKKHVKLFSQTWGTTKNFSILKKYFKIYLSSIPNSSQMREQLMSTSSCQQVLDLLENLTKESFGTK